MDYSHPSSSENKNVSVLPLYPLYILTKWCFQWLVKISYLSLSLYYVHFGSVIDIPLCITVCSKRDTTLA